MNPPEQLIANYLDNALNDADQAELNAWLKADAANMLRFTEAVMFEQQIRTAAQAKAQHQAANGFNERATPAASRIRWLSWRPLTAAAAGIVFGMFCTSVVFAYAVPRVSLDRQQVIPLFSDGFENVKAVFGRGFPNDAGGWSGDFAAVVSTEKEIFPKEGQHMVQLAPNEGRKFCAAARIVDLAAFLPASGDEIRTVEVTASFHGMGAEWPDRNQIRLAAFAEAPQDVKAIWNADARLEQALQHIGRTVKMKPREHGWQTLKVAMEIPAGTRSLVIHLGAGVADDSGPKTLHYIDDVHVQFVITETTP